jgi:acetyl-CoA C-acetyltransferase
MSLDPRTPVLVGAGAITERVDDPREASEPVDLMATALERAAEDAGSKALLAAVDSIWTPRGFWSYSNPGQLLAERFGASGVRNIVAEIGILQTSILGRAARALAEGHGEVAMIVGGEARDRSSRLQRLGLEAPMTPQTASQPDEILRPAAEIMGRFEIDLGLVTPTIQYAMIDNALRYHEDQSLTDHRAELGALWGEFNRVAVENPDAWNRSPMTPEAIVSCGESNRMLSFPYTKSLVSQWNVNQSGGLILCTLEKARRLGLDSSRFIYPLAVVDSEHMLTLSERRDLYRSPGFEHAGERALSHAGLAIDEVEHLELYSCFPAAVRVQQRELGVDLGRSVTQTGGMSFAGGPLNNFTIQSWVKMVEVMRNDPGSAGLVTAVSGLLTKQGVSILGSEPSRPFLFDSVTSAAKADQITTTVEPGAEGHARIAAYTVIHSREADPTVALVCDFDESRRTLRVIEDPELAEEGMHSELCGREVLLGSDNALRWT